jgi:hypothetical protein
MGWGGYQKPKKSKDQLALERLAKQFPGTQAELIELVAKCKKKVKLISPAPSIDDDFSEYEPSGG